MVYQPTSRVLTVLELLQTFGQMSAQQMANRLEVDARTIRRYVTTLQDMGIPVEAEYGRYGGYALRPGYKLPPLMFNDGEVLVLTLGLLLARRSHIAGASAAIESALAKIERVLPETLQEQLRALQEAALISQEDDERPAVDAQILAALSVATQQHRRVRLRYEASGGKTERDFDPYAVLYHEGSWYTVGYCHLREGLRTFRLDRVRQAITLPHAFAPPDENFNALDYMLSSFVAIPDRWNIDVLLDTPLEEARRKLPRPVATLAQEGDRVRLRASMPNLDEVARMLIALACPMTILQPPELRETMLKIADEIRGIATDAAAASQ